MPQVQHLCVVIPDDLEEPLTLIKDALADYLWRSPEMLAEIYIELIHTDEGH
jgi:hypothetical protein